MATIGGQFYKIDFYLLSYLYKGDMARQFERAGKAWYDDEISQLLQEIRAKKSIEEIATIHQRTSGGIIARLREIAADYYYNDERPLEQICAFTGLSEEVVMDAIERRGYRNRMKEEKEKCKEERRGNKQTKLQLVPTSNTQELVELKNWLNTELSGIKATLNEILTLQKQKPKTLLVKQTPKTLGDNGS